MPSSLAEKVGLLLTHSVVCTEHFKQHAGLEALSGPQDFVEIVHAEYNLCSGTGGCSEREGHDRGCLVNWVVSCRMAKKKWIR